MTTSTTQPDGNTVHPERPNLRDKRLHSRLPNDSRVRSERRPRFDLNAFSQAIEQCNINYQLARYAPDADIHIIDPDNPPASPQTLRGTRAIHAWLLDSSANELDPHVIHLADGGDRIAFTTQWRREDGTQALASSTAALQDGLISAQRTIVVHY